MKNSPPTAAAHPNTFSWYVLVQRFSDVVRAAWTGPQAAAPKQAKVVAAKPEAVKEEPKKAAADEDEMDLFGDDDEDDVVSCLLPKAALVGVFNRASLSFPPINIK